MSSVCQTYLQASNTSLFDNSCAIQKSAVTPAVLTGLTTCCVGGGGVHTTDDGCFTYCNITSSYDGLFWEFCLLDNLSTSEVAILFADDNDADVRILFLSPIPRASIVRRISPSPRLSAIQRNKLLMCSSGPAALMMMRAAQIPRQPSPLATSPPRGSVRARRSPSAVQALLSPRRSCPLARS